MKGIVGRKGHSKWSQNCLLKKERPWKCCQLTRFFFFFPLFSSKNLDIPNPHSLTMWKSSYAHLDLNFQWLARPFCHVRILVLASSGVQMVTEEGSKHSPHPTPYPRCSREPSLPGCPSNTLAMWCKELTHWKRPWCWERLRAGREGDDRGWDGRMASLIPVTWFWADSRR